MKRHIYALVLAVACASCTTTWTPPEPAFANEDYPYFTDGREYNPAARKAMDAHYKDSPLCAVCATKRIAGRRNEVHHKIPWHIREDLAAERTNMVTLCRTHHWVIGHCKNWHDYNIEVDATIKAVRQAYRNTSVSYRLVYGDNK